MTARLRRLATLADIADLLPRLRAADLAEIEAATGRAPFDVLAESVTTSEWSEVLLIEGGVEALGGLGALSPTTGVPWLVGSARLGDDPRWLLRESRRQLRRMLRRFAALENRVDARNAAAIRYLRALGVRLDPPAPHGPQGLPFHRFSLHREAA